MTTPDYDWTAGVEAMVQQEWAKAKAEHQRQQEEAYPDEAYARQQEAEWARADAEHQRKQEAERQARAPRLAVDNPEPEPPALLPIAVSRPELTLVHDRDANNALASDVEALAGLAMARIKETLSKPFDPGDANYTALLKFVSSVYGSTMNTLLRADENRLKQRAVDRLPELLAKVAEQERLRDARRTIEINPGEDPSAA
jgi:hypothetical protein